METAPEGLPIIAMRGPEHDDKPREACGVFGVYAPGEHLAGMTYLGLEALQHRGQEAAGIAVTNGNQMLVLKDTGRVNHVFKGGELLAGIDDSNIAIGHVRYGTNKVGGGYEAAQPMYMQSGENKLASGHNGNLTNFYELCDEYGFNPSELGSDSDLINRAIVSEWDAHGDLNTAVTKASTKFEGAFSLVLMTDSQLIGVRDPNGFRPLMLGALPKGGWVLASELPALDIVGARMVREIAPGEIITIDKNGINSNSPFEKRDPSLCAFEYVYFSRPDQKMYGESVKIVRERMGEILAHKLPVEADMVVGVPDSGIDAAIGLARESGIPFDRALVKNHYVGRTFIAATQLAREKGVRVKLNPIPEVIHDKRLIITDDSIVRGTTQRELVRMLREAGAREVHVRISSAPYKWPCFYGMDTGSPDELLAANMSVEEMCRAIGADTLAFMSPDDIQQSVGKAAGKLCMACMTGDYPSKIGK